MAQETFWTKILPEKTRDEILEEAFGIINHDGVLLDEEGDEIGNVEFNLNTIKGILEYQKQLAFDEGVYKAKAEIANALNPTKRIPMDNF